MVEQNGTLPIVVGVDDSDAARRPSPGRSTRPSSGAARYTR
ncbi:hypothetical protein [Kibdelosporangium philippinense]